MPATSERDCPTPRSSTAEAPQKRHQLFVVELDDDFGPRC